MTEVITTFCDFCNPEQFRNADGRGYSEYPSRILIKDFGWARKRLPNGTMGIMCPDCQDEMESEMNCKVG